jgi:hypothetical protein
VRAVPGRESEAKRLLLLLRLAGVVLGASLSLPSSEAMSVIREDIMLGGPATSCRGYWGKLSSRSVGEGVDLAPLSPGVAILRGAPSQSYSETV